MPQLDMRQIEHKRLFTGDEINRAIVPMAMQLVDDYKDKDLLIVGILTGAFKFVSELTAFLDCFGMVHEVAFTKVDRYGNKATPMPPEIRWFDLPDYEDKHVLIVDNVFDTGKTMESVYLAIKSTKLAASVKSLVLVKKPEECHHDYKSCKGYRPDYAGFQMEEDKWIYGYGMDLKGLWRGLGFVAYRERDSVHTS